MKFLTILTLISSITCYNLFELTSNDPEKILSQGEKGTFDVLFDLHGTLVLEQDPSHLGHVAAQSSRRWSTVAPPTPNLKTIKLFREFQAKGHNCIIASAWDEFEVTLQNVIDIKMHDLLTTKIPGNYKKGTLKIIKDDDIISIEYKQNGNVISTRKRDSDRWYRNKVYAAVVSKLSVIHKDKVDFLISEAGLEGLLGNGNVMLIDDSPYNLEIFKDDAVNTPFENVVSVLYRYSFRVSAQFQNLKLKSFIPMVPYGNKDSLKLQVYMLPNGVTTVEGERLGEIKPLMYTLVGQVHNKQKITPDARVPINDESPLPIHPALIKKESSVRLAFRVIDERDNSIIHPLQMCEAENYGNAILLSNDADKILSAVRLRFLPEVSHDGNSPTGSKYRCSFMYHFDEEPTRNSAVRPISSNLNPWLSDRKVLVQVISEVESKIKNSGASTSGRRAKIAQALHLKIKPKKKEALELGINDETTLILGKYYQKCKSKYGDFGIGVNQSERQRNVEILFDFMREYGVVGADEVGKFNMFFGI